MNSRNANGPLPRQGSRPADSSLARSQANAPLIIPELGEIARQVPPALIQTLRWQVSPGDRVAVYTRRSRDARILILGPQRRHYTAPARLDGEWKLAGLVEILDENGEKSLPVRIA